VFHGARGLGRSAFDSHGSKLGSAFAEQLRTRSLLDTTHFGYNDSAVWERCECRRSLLWQESS